MVQFMQLPYHTFSLIRGANPVAAGNLWADSPVVTVPACIVLPVDDGSGCRGDEKWTGAVIFSLRGNYCRLLPTTA